MKRFIFASSVLFLAVLISGCSKDNILDNNNGRTPLQFRITTGKVTRANANAGEINFMNNKTIAVTVMDASGNPGYVYESNGTTNYSTFYVVWDGSRATTYKDDAATQEVDLFAPFDGSNVYFLALANTGNTANTLTPTTSDGTNMTLTGYVNTPQSDLVWATSGAVNSNSTSITLSFDHISSQLMFNVAKNDAGYNIAITALSINVPSAGDWTTSGSAGFGDDFTAYADYSLSNMAAVSTNQSTLTAAAYASNNDKYATFGSLFVLPCTLATATLNSILTDPSLTVSYTVTGPDGTTPLGGGTDVNIKFKDMTGITAWTKATRHLYTFKPSLSSIGPKMTISVTSWLPEDDTQITPEEIEPTNNN